MYFDHGLYNFFCVVRVNPTHCWMSTVTVIQTGNVAPSHMAVLRHGSFCVCSNKKHSEITFYFSDLFRCCIVHRKEKTGTAQCEEDLTHLDPVCLKADTAARWGHLLPTERKSLLCWSCYSTGKWRVTEKSRFTRKKQTEIQSDWRKMQVIFYPSSSFEWITNFKYLKKTFEDICHVVSLKD